MYLIDTTSFPKLGATLHRQSQGYARSIRFVSCERIDAGRDHVGYCFQTKVRPTNSAHRMEWLRKLRYDHLDRILPVTDEIAVEWSRIAAITPRGDRRGLIAATALIHDLIVVSRNVADFRDTYASLINPSDI